MKTTRTALLLALVSMTLSAQQVPVTLKLQPNQPVTIRMQSKQRIQQSVSGQQIAVDVQADRVVNARLVNKTDGELTLSLTFDTLRTLTKAAMFSQEINSTKPGKEPVEKVLNKLSQTPILVRITPTGKFLGFDNYALLREELLRALDDVPATKRDAAVKQVESMIKESSLRSMVEPLFSYLPEKAIQVGETWENTYVTTSNDLSTVVLVDFKGSSLEGYQLNYTTSSRMESLPSTNPNAQASMDMQGTATGEGCIDTRTGLRTIDTEKGAYTGTATVRQGGQEMTIPMTIESETTTTMTL